MARLKQADVKIKPRYPLKNSAQVRPSHPLVPKPGAEDASRRRGRIKPQPVPDSEIT